MVEIRGSNLFVTQKLFRIAKLTNELGLIKPLLLHLLAEVQRVGWRERSSAMRGVIGGAGAGVVASVAGPMAGVAAFGTAVAVPVLLLGMGGGAILGAIIQELSVKR